MLLFAFVLCFVILDDSRTEPPSLSAVYVYLLIFVSFVCLFCFLCLSFCFCVVSLVWLGVLVLFPRVLVLLSVVWRFGFGLLCFVLFCCFLGFCFCFWFLRGALCLLLRVWFFLVSVWAPVLWVVWRVFLFVLLRVFVSPLFFRCAFRLLGFVFCSSCFVRSRFGALPHHCFVSHLFCMFARYLFSKLGRNSFWRLFFYSAQHFRTNAIPSFSDHRVEGVYISVGGIRVPFRSGKRFPSCFTISRRASCIYDMSYFLIKLFRRFSQSYPLWHRYFWSRNILSQWSPSLPLRGGGDDLSLEPAQARLQPLLERHNLCLITQEALGSCFYLCWAFHFGPSENARENVAYWRERLGLPTHDERSMYAWAEDEHIRGLLALRPCILRLLFINYADFPEDENVLDIIDTRVSPNFNPDDDRLPVLFFVYWHRNWHGQHFDVILPFDRLSQFFPAHAAPPSPPAPPVLPPVPPLSPASRPPPPGPPPPCSPPPVSALPSVPPLSLPSFAPLACSSVPPALPACHHDASFFGNIGFDAALNEPSNLTNYSGYLHSYSVEHRSDGVFQKGEITESHHKRKKEKIHEPLNQGGGGGVRLANSVAAHAPFPPPPRVQLHFPDESCHDANLFDMLPQLASDPMRLNDRHLDLFTDGSGKLGGGFAFAFFDSHSGHLFTCGFGPLELSAELAQALQVTDFHQKNGRAEVQAPLQAFAFLLHVVLSARKSGPVDLKPYERIVIHTDSQFLRGVFCASAAAKSKFVEDAADILLQLRDCIFQAGFSVSCVWVQGHSTDVANIFVDKLATSGARGKSCNVVSPSAILADWRSYWSQFAPVSRGTSIRNRVLEEIGRNGVPSPNTQPQDAASMIAQQNQCFFRHSRKLLYNRQPHRSRVQASQISSFSKLCIVTYNPCSLLHGRKLSLLRMFSQVSSSSHPIDIIIFPGTRLGAGQTSLQVEDCEGYRLYSAACDSDTHAGVAIAVRLPLAQVARIRPLRINARILELHLRLQGSKKCRVALDLVVVGVYVKYRKLGPRQQYRHGSAVPPGPGAEPPGGPPPGQGVVPPGPGGAEQQWDGWSILQSRHPSLRKRSKNRTRHR